MLVATLVAVLLLGHVCELPAFVDLAAHATGAGHHHEAHDQPDDERISCDVVDATNTAHARGGVGLEPARIGLRDGSIPALEIGSVAEEASAPPPRPPLFLLHRSLLI